MNTPASVGPVPVVRTRDGYWCHPVLSRFYADRDYIRAGEYQAWLAEHRLEDCLVYLDEDEDSAAARDYAANGGFSGWEPPLPDGEGWFIGAIFDGEDYGPSCIWLRRREVPCGDR